MESVSPPIFHRLCHFSWRNFGYSIVFEQKLMINAVIAEALALGAQRRVDKDYQLEEGHHLEVELRRKS